MDKDMNSTPFDQFILMLTSSHQSVQLEGLIGIRNLITNEPSADYSHLMTSGAIQKLLEFMMQDENTSLQVESAWAVANLCAGTTQMVEYIVDLGGLEISVALLDSGSKTVVDQTLWIISNILGESLSFRDTFLENGYMDKLLSILQKFQNSNKILNGVLWAVSNILRGDPYPTFQDISTVLPLLKRVISNPQPVDLMVRALSAITCISETNLEVLLDQGFIPALIGAIEIDNTEILHFSLRILCNFLTGDDAQADEVLKYPEFVPRLYELASHQCKTIRKEACWGLSNIAAGNKRQHAIIADHDEYIEGLKTIIFGDNKKVASEASIIFSNLIYNADTFSKKKLVDKCSYLDCFEFALDELNRQAQEAAISTIYYLVVDARDGPSNSDECQILKEFQKKNLLKKIEYFSDSEKLDSEIEEILSYFDEFGSEEILPKSQGQKVFASKYPQNNSESEQNSYETEEASFEEIETSF